MKTETSETFSKITPKLFVIFLALLTPIQYAHSAVENHANLVLEHTSGDDEIDQVRRDIQQIPTDESNYLYRAAILRLWENALQQQGGVMKGRFTPLETNGSNVLLFENEAHRREKIIKYIKLVNEGCLVLEEIQKEIIEGSPRTLTALAPDPATVTPPVKNETSWPQFHGTLTNVGSNGNDGPVYGRVAWKFPVGLAWESRPVVEGNKVHLTSPGVRNILLTLDIETGEAIHTAKQFPVPSGTYTNPAFASTPVVLKDHILLREIGSRGNTGLAKEIAYINKASGELEKDTFAGHIDYRIGYAPLVANEKFMVFPFSVQNLEQKPPATQAFNHIICKDTKTGQQLRDVHVGHTFAEPLLDDEDVFIGTKSGFFYSFKASEADDENNRTVKARDQVVTWKFKAGDSINRQAATNANHVFFGANDGTVYCLDKVTGHLIWKFTVAEPVPAAFRHFSTPLVSGDRVFIGSADKTLYCLDAASGELLFTHASSDWIRARPVATATNVFFASMNGDLYNVDFSGGRTKEVWKKRIGDHWIYADLALSGDNVLMNDSDLYSYCVNANTGDVRWRFSTIKAFHQDDGYRVLTDQIAGGGYYQSKAIAAHGQVFIGTPSRFVYSLDAETGAEIWKFELGAAVSGAPVYDSGKIFIGQQGGEDDFYCLDSATGQMIWKQTIGWDWGSAAVSDGLVFVPGIDGFVNCLDANNGHIIWRFRTDKSVCSEPMVMGDHVYFGSWDAFLYKFEKRTGKLVWKYDGAGTDSGVTIGFDGKLISPGLDMSCLDAETGELLWKPDFTHGTNSTPAYHDGQVFVSLRPDGERIHQIENCQIVALDANTGERNWTFDGPGGHTGPVVGANGYVYSGGSINPFFYAMHEKGNGDGTTDTLFRVRMENKVLESTAALYRGRAYILSGGGYFYAIE